MAQTSKIRYHKKADWKAGKVKAKNLTSGMKYYTWRGREKQDGREWETGDGRQLTYWEARDEVLEASRESKYTYSFVCGTREDELSAEQYRQVLGEHFDRVYFVRHHDQGQGDDRHPHAHVIATRGSYMREPELNEMRGRIAQIESELERRRELERTQDRNRSQGWER